MTTNISRRRFLAYFGIGVGSAVALVAAPSVWQKLSGWAKGLFVSRETMTLVDFARIHDPKGKAATIADLLNQRNEILNDVSSIWLVGYDEKRIYSICGKSGKLHTFKRRSQSYYKALARSRRNQPGNAWAS